MIIEVPQGMHERLHLVESVGMRIICVAPTSAHTWGITLQIQDEDREDQTWAEQALARSKSEPGRSARLEEYLRGRSRCSGS